MVFHLLRNLSSSAASNLEPAGIEGVSQTACPQTRGKDDLQTISGKEIARHPVMRQGDKLWPTKAVLGHDSSVNNIDDLLVPKGVLQVVQAQ